MTNKATRQKKQRVRLNNPGINLCVKGQGTHINSIISGAKRQQSGRRKGNPRGGEPLKWRIELRGNQSRDHSLRGVRRQPQPPRTGAPKNLLQNPPTDHHSRVSVRESYNVFPRLFKINLALLVEFLLEKQSNSRVNRFVRSRISIVRTPNNQRERFHYDYWERDEQI